MVKRLLKTEKMLSFSIQTAIGNERRAV